jgi:hypothetical protein
MFGHNNCKRFAGKERKKERKKEKGTDMVVWDEMVVIEFGAGYWNMN